MTRHADTELRASELVPDIFDTGTERLPSSGQFSAATISGVLLGATEALVAPLILGTTMVVSVLTWWILDAPWAGRRRRSWRAGRPGYQPAPPGGCGAPPGPAPPRGPGAGGGGGRGGGGSGAASIGLPRRASLPRSGRRAARGRATRQGHSTPAWCMPKATPASRARITSGMPQMRGFKASPSLLTFLPGRSPSCLGQGGLSSLYS